VLAGVEALIRWHHPEHGAIPPDEFIHSAEQTGLIKPLTLWVLNAALRALQAWHQDGYDFGVAVNLSVKSLHDPQLPEVIRLLLRSWEQRPELLTFEITESALMADPATALEVLAQISNIGCRLSLDDFGTGYSSLAYLQKLPIDELKIDRSFVVAMTRDDNAAVIVRSVVKLAKGLGLSVVAEGVESEEAFTSLRALGCDHVQGFFFGPSMGDDDFRAWLRTSPWGRVARPHRALELGSFSTCVADPRRRPLSPSDRNGASLPRSRRIRAGPGRRGWRVWPSRGAEPWLAPPGSPAPAPHRSRRASNPDESRGHRRRSA
jgi:diguanylate cyclase